MDKDPTELANIYSTVLPSGHEGPLPEWEDVLAERHGGSPEEWIPEAEICKDLIRGMMEGRPFAIVSPEPEAEGIFAGYHKVSVLLPGIETADGGLLVREIYATPDQIKSGHFRAKQEGIFAIDGHDDRVTE